jgi:hypothetical protein
MSAPEQAELDRVRRIYAYILLRDPRAADEMDEQAAELKRRAAAIREEFARPRAEPDNLVATGGTGTRVQMAVVGPDGEVKSRHDTGEVP